jgi:hypothetical protein
MAPHEEPEQTEEAGGSGGYGLAGYDYQIDVSVWLALDLLLASKLAHELILEPDSQEDVEADLSETEFGRVTTDVAMPGGYRLVVQAKLRTGDAWTVPKLNALLKHGKKRVSAAKRLEDPKVRYLLVTSAGLNGGTRGLKVRSAGVWPASTGMPVSTVKALPKGAAGRVAIIGNEDPERLETDIRRLLTDNFRVPNANWEACRNALREEARIRITIGASSIWSRDQIQQIIERFEGYLASSPELDHYVRPTNWPTLQGALRENHALLIIGQSGTGKTLATIALWEDLRHEVPGLKRVSITMGPKQLRDDRTAPPVLYDIEDPWGRFRFNPDSLPWNEQLSQFMSEAHAGRYILATSRLDVAQAAGALEGVKRWQVPLEAEHYGPKERSRLYRNHIPGLPVALRLLATNSEARVLEELSTPLEIRKFFDALPTLDRELLQTNPARLVQEGIDQAHRDSIEQTVINQIEARGDVKAAAVIWGMLKAHPKLSLDVLRSLEEGLADKDQELERGVRPLVAFFVAARNLRQSEELVNYYHPRVESGIQAALLRHELPARRTLENLVEVLVEHDAPGTSWGIAAAAQLVLAAANHPSLKLKLSDLAQQALDVWTAAQALKGGKDADEYLKLAAAVASPESTVGEIARWLYHRPDRSFGGFMHWGAPDRDAAWYERMSADPAVKQALEIFIREVMPQDHSYYGADFTAKVSQFVPGLTPAFLEAASEVVHFGVSHTADAIAAGALQDLEGFEAIVDTACEVLRPTEEELARAAETHLAIINELYSDEYAEHIGESDEGYTAGEFLEAYAAKVRAERGWAFLAQHRHQEQLRYFWLRALVKSDGAPPSREELAGAFAAARGTTDEDDLWHLLQNNWEGAYADALAERVREGHGDINVRHAALSCLVEHAPDRMSEIAIGLETAGRLGRLFEIAIELGRLKSRRARHDGRRHDRAADAAMRQLPAELREVAVASAALADDHRPRPLSDGTRAKLEAAVDGGEILRRFRMELSEHDQLNIADDVVWLLQHTEDVDVAVAAISAAVRSRMSATLEQALRHRFAHVVALALEALAETHTAPLPERLLALAAADGSPVRRSLVKALRGKPHEAHLPTLLALSRDRWSKHASYGANDGAYPIAREAVAGIGELGPIRRPTADHLIETAIGTDDLRLLHDIMELLARQGGAEVQQRLFQIAVTPGRGWVRKAASNALFAAHAEIADDVLALVEPKWLLTRAAPVAANLAALLGLRGEEKPVIAAAEALAAKPERRALIALLGRAAAEHSGSIAEKCIRLLPNGHPARRWALGEIERLTEEELADIADPRLAAEIMKWMPVEQSA